MKVHFYFSRELSGEFNVDLKIISYEIDYVPLIGDKINIWPMLKEEEGKLVDPKLVSELEESILNFGRLIVVDRTINYNAVEGTAHSNAHVYLSFDKLVNGQDAG